MTDIKCELVMREIEMISTGTQFHMQQRGLKRDGVASTVHFFPLSPKLLNLTGI